MDKKFFFDEASHRYFLDSKEIPSVTKILKSVGLINTDFYTDQGKERGHAIHKAVWLDWNQRKREAEMDSEIMGYLEAFRSFRNEAIFKPLSEYCESPLYHPSLGYGGTPDLVGYLNGNLALIDMKSGSVSSWAAYQLAAYKEILHAHKVYVISRWILQLSEDGRFKLIPIMGLNDTNIFLSALNIFRAQESSKILSS